MGQRPNPFVQCAASRTSFPVLLDEISGAFDRCASVALNRLFSLCLPAGCCALLALMIFGGYSGCWLPISSTASDLGLVPHPAHMAAGRKVSRRPHGRRSRVVVRPARSVLSARRRTAARAGRGRRHGGSARRRGVRVRRAARTGCPWWRDLRPAHSGPAHSACNGLSATQD